MAMVQIEQLTKRFGNTAAVDAVNLTVDDGEFVALLGPSGCGKTTLLRLLAGFLEPDGGRILVGGQEMSSLRRVTPPDRRNMSMIFQSYALWPNKSVFDNVAFGLHTRRVPRNEISERVHRMLKAVKLGHLTNRYPLELSGGQQQRVALARALVVNPEIVLLDEPLSNLDANLREEMRFEIRRIHDQFRFTTVYVTHDQAEAMVTADRIVVMDRGHIQQVGSPEEVFERPVSRFVAEFVGRTNILPGKLVGLGSVECGGFALKVEPGHGIVSGTDVLICCRPHHITLTNRGYPSCDATNSIEASIVRQTYLGVIREYIIEVQNSDLVLKVDAPSTSQFAVGERVRVSIAPSDLRVLTA